MTITLPANQKDWIEEQVSAGHFSWVEEALSVAISDLRAASTADLSWMKPYVEEARRSAETGDVISGEDFIEELHQTIASLRSS